MPDLPFMKWYAAEAEVDEDFRLMTDTELGFYMRCLNHAWLNRGLPGEEWLIARLFHKSLDEFSELWKMVGRKFVLENDRYVNRRQEKDRKEALEKSDKASKSIRTRYERSTNVVTLVTPDNYERSTNEPIRASDSDSSSLSSVSQERELEREPKLPDPTDEEADEFRNWCEAVYARHPKKSLRLISLHALQQRFARDGPARTVFDQNHKLHCQTTTWREKNGLYAPKLPDFVADEGWKYPPFDDSPPKKETALDRLMRKELEKEKGVSA